MSSHRLLTTRYTMRALKPSEVILLMAGTQPDKEKNMGYCILSTRPAMVFGSKKPLWLVARYALRCKQTPGQARQEALQQCIPRDDVSVGT